MDSETAAPLQRSVSQLSSASVKSSRSHTLRPSKARKLTSQPSSSACSIAASDKSLTSFPSFSPESPREDSPFTLGFRDQQSAASSRQPSGTQPATAIVDGLTTSPCLSADRRSLFEDAPLSARRIPGALHHADDEHISRLISRHGAVSLVRQVAEDLAQRDAQIAALRRKADDRERALRKIVLDCGISNLDLETRLRALEKEAKQNEQLRRGGEESGLSDLMSDAMAEGVRDGSAPEEPQGVTVRLGTGPATSNADNTKGTLRGWKEYLWGGGTSKRSSRASSIRGDTNQTLQPTVVKATPLGERRPTIAEDLFTPPEADSMRSSSRASSVQSSQAAGKPSLASLALRLVAGGPPAGREGEARGRASSATMAGPLRDPSTSSAKTTGSVRAVSTTQGGPKALMAMRRTGSSRTIPVSGPTAQSQERWDGTSAGPVHGQAARQDSYGPVEMDTILPLEGQPPTQTHMYNNYNGSGYLTDRFGFIYDQRRKRRQREAARMARHIKKGSRSEMLTNGRDNIFSDMDEADDRSGGDAAAMEGMPGSPVSADEARDGAKPRRWQDYLKIATFPTELLSHTPSISVPGFEVMEGGEVAKPSPGLITSEERGFVPSPSTTVAAANHESRAAREDQPAGTLVKEDTEPVKLLLRQLGDVHDNLQREKTVRWNDFLRKVRAERRRESVAASEAGLPRGTSAMPETMLADGELVGIAGLGNKGRVGRAKWIEFKTLVLGGIPVAYRPKIWTECSGAAASRIPGYYDDLVGRSAEDDDPQVVTQIGADITRTLTDNIFFREGPGVGKLEEVLLAYARRNHEVGYCQGMNLVVANLLLIVPSAEDAFWILTSMVENILPANYYDHSLLASRADQQVLRSYVAEVLPKLSQHFEELAIDLETMTFQWFLSVFTDCLSAEALFRVWDVVLCTHDGSTFLFQVALALLKLNEQQLLECASPAGVYTYINHQMTNHAISIDGLIQASEGLRRVVKREDVEARRRKSIEAEKEATRLQEERNANRRPPKAAPAPDPAGERGSAPGGGTAGSSEGSGQGGGQAERAGEEPRAKAPGQMEGNAA